MSLRYNLLGTFLLASVAFAAQAAQDDVILEKADKLLEEAKAAYETARAGGAVSAFVDAGFKLEEARIKYLVLQEIGQGEKQKIAAERLRAVNQLGKLIHDGKVAVSGGNRVEVPVVPPPPGAEPAVKAPSVAPAVDVSKRMAIPDPAKQKEADKLVKDLFKDGYAKRANVDRKVLAKQLLEQAARSGDDPVAQWVLYREAQDVATQSGEIQVAIEAIDTAARTFDIDALSLKSQALMTIGKAVKAPEDIVAAADALGMLVDELIGVDQYDAADKAAQLALQLAKKGTDASLAIRAGIRARDVTDAKVQFTGLKKILETLAKNPEDAAANAEMGKYLCFVKGAWDLGLRFMVKGSDATVKALAEKEVAFPSQSMERMAIADGWFDLAEKEKSLLRKSQIQRHSKELYESAMNEATALMRVKIEKRLESLSSIGALPGQPGGSGTVDLTTLTPKRATVGWGGLEVNMNNLNRTVMVAGKECKRYIFAHPPSTLIYDIPPGSRQFLATGVKLDRKDPGVSGTFKFIVVVDGKTLYTSIPLNESKNLEIEMTVNLPVGARELTLQTDPCGDYSADWSTWAYPRFQK